MGVELNYLIKYVEQLAEFNILFRFQNRFNYIFYVDVNSLN